MLIITDTNINVKESESHTEKQTVEYSAETIYAAILFERLSPEMQKEILEVLRQINVRK